MHISEFDYDLPEALIAQHPPTERGGSRLLSVPQGALSDHRFTDLPSFLQAGDVLVMNDTRVMKARLFGEKASGGKIEALVERVLDSHTVLAHIRSSKSPKVGSQLHFQGGWQADMQQRVGELFQLRFAGEEDIYHILEQSGRLPLPPYIERTPDGDDESRYQTVFAREQGAVAAPTAGLHFTEALLAQLATQGIKLCWITLHVGAGTFQPVRVEDITQHHMHSECYHIPSETVAAIAEAKQRGNKIVAVGTTSLRALESAAREGVLSSGRSETDIFITPGFRFRVVDALLTNFHLPKSTLLMLVSAFAGISTIRQAYQHAVAAEYRFFSYGDAMLLQRCADAAHPDCLQYRP